MRWVPLFLLLVFLSCEGTRILIRMFGSEH